MFSLPAPRINKVRESREANICWDGNQLWMAEPELTGYKDPSIWESIVTWQINYFRENYCR
jgi:hypothetical protein